MVNLHHGGKLQFSSSLHNFPKDSDVRHERQYSPMRDKRLIETMDHVQRISIQIKSPMPLWEVDSLRASEDDRRKFASIQVQKSIKKN